MTGRHILQPDSCQRKTDRRMEERKDRRKKGRKELCVQKCTHRGTGNSKAPGSEEFSTVVC